MSTQDPHRLPHTAVPSHYRIVLEPDIDAARFEGSVEITLDVGAPTAALVANAIELEIGRSTLETGGQTLDLETSFDERLERVTFTRSDGETVPAGPATLTASFTGVLNDELRGFYRSTYRDAEGHEQTLATSQLQSTDARRVFPCWDEPEFKATFGVTLVVQDGLLAVSNGAEVANEPTDDGRRRVTFADTPSMSTYLAAFVVGDLEVSRTVTSNGGVPIRVVTPPGRSHLADFALDCATFCLDFFADYYDVPYCGSKLDLVAVPDFAMGAMENLGCVTFRETALLVDPTTATRAEQERVADVVAHEIAHMWFGDLVTMRWWNGIWLNEAFATFMEILAVDAYRPSWGRWTTEKLTRSPAYDIDALGSTRPIEFPVHDPSEAEGMFDVLTYNKGGAVLRMLEQFLGAEGFRDGVRLYLRRHAYGNTETADLWDALEEATGQPCRRIMDSWIHQGGFPLVTVERGADTELVVDQQRFVFAGADAAPSGDHDQGPGEWVVPMVLRAIGDVGDLEHRVVLEPGPPTRTDPRVHAEAVVANAGAEGFYRVAYGDDLRRGLAERLERLTPVERVAFVADQWAAVLAGHLDAPSFLEVASRFRGEDHPDVWSALITGLGGVSALTEGPARPLMQRWVRVLVGPGIERLGQRPDPADSTERRRTRALLLSTAAGLGADPEAAAWARAVLDDPTRGDSELAAAAPFAVARHGDAATWDELWERRARASTPQDEQRFLFALASLPSPELAARTLARCLDDVRSQDAPFVVLRLLQNRDVGRDAWRWLRDHWAEVNGRFPRNTIIRMVAGVTSLSHPSDAAEIEAFFAEHPIEQAALTQRQVLERLRVNVALRERETPGVEALLGA